MPLALCIGRFKLVLQSELLGCPAVASFDVEEHFRIEAAAGLEISIAAEADYAGRMEAATRRLLDQLGAASVRATFFIVGETAATHPPLIRALHDAGHEIGPHIWDHRSDH